MPGFNSKMAKISGKRTPCCGTTCQEESNDISYVWIGGVSWEEFGYKVKRDSFLQVYQRVPSQCLGLIPRWQKIRENAPHVVQLHAKRNQTIYHMSRSVQSPGRSLGTKLTEILFHRYLDGFRTYAFLITWLLDNFFQDDLPKKFTFFQASFQERSKKIGCIVSF